MSVRVKVHTKARKPVFGVGINDYEYSMKDDNGKDMLSYRTWQDMLRRCYDKKCHEKQPTYIGCSVCAEWIYFSNFKKWYDENFPQELSNAGIKFNLDKDLLIKDNKIYSPSTCIFLPKKINSFLANKKSSNTSGLLGVTWSKSDKKWQAQIRDFDSHKNKYLGLFTNTEDASKAYETARRLESEKAKEWMRGVGIYSEEIIQKIK